MKTLLFKILDELGFYTEGDRKLRKEKREARQLAKAKKIADTKHKANNRRYYVMKSTFNLPFDHVGQYYIISSSEVQRSRTRGYLSKHCTIDWVLENADYFTR